LPSNRPDGTFVGMEKVVVRVACGNSVRLWSFLEFLDTESGFGGGMRASVIDKLIFIKQ